MQTTNNFNFIHEIGRVLSRLTLPTLFRVQGHPLSDAVSRGEDEVYTTSLPKVSIFASSLAPMLPVLPRTVIAKKRDMSSR